VDLDAVKAATTPELVKCAVGAATNAQSLLDDAELLAAAARQARAYALAALAVEEAAKSVGLTVLAVMPQNLRAQAPVGRMLEWHQLKLVGGILMAVVPVPFGTRTHGQLSDMPPGRAAEILDIAQALAKDVDRLKQRGMYADIDSTGRTRLPSEVTETEVAAQLSESRQAVSAASVLLHPDAPAWLANPPAPEVEFTCALASAFTEAGYGRTPEAAAAVLLSAIGKLRAQHPRELLGSKPSRSAAGRRLTLGLWILKR
jgi:AbiV family abortive infection protein